MDTVTETEALLVKDDLSYSEHLHGNIAALQRAACGNFKMAETNGFRQFLILMYKGMLLRKRHYICTFFELVIPVLIASIPAIILSEMNYKEVRTVLEDGPSPNLLWKNATIYEPFDPYVSLKHKNYDLEFLYSPNNSLTIKFVQDAIKRFKEKAGVSDNLTSKGMSSEKDMELYSLYRQRQDVGIILIGTVFNGFESVNGLPESLDYKIRYGDGVTLFQTQLKYRVNGPQTKNVYTDDTFFLGWQTAVEQTFIQRKAAEMNVNLDYKVWMQRFPYPEHRNAVNTLSYINSLPWWIGFSFIFFMNILVKRIIEEKVNRSKELLKMMGMTDYVYWISTFANYFVIALITSLIISIIYKAPLKNSFVFLKHTDFLILFLLLLLFLTSLILFCMAFSVFFNRAVIATILILGVHSGGLVQLLVSFFLLDSEVSYIPLPTGQKFAICLFPPGSLCTMFYLMAFSESTGEGVLWSNLTEYSLVPDFNMLMVIGSMILSCLIYSFIIWYFDKVWPFQTGVPLPFYFLFTRSYWFGTQSKVGEDIELIEPQIDYNSEFFEQEPAFVTPGVIVKNLTKTFRTGMQNKTAVKDLSLNIYQGQITALLGHNGAGKTTTINILTGLFRPSKGTASINGRDILKETTQARRGLGVCPQHNVLFDTLTVEEHLKIYAGLKGVSWSKMVKEIDSVLDSLKLADKRHELTKNLSGGMKRKLSLGIAIIGGSKVLFLDEPSSGLDVEARRIVWDALLEMRYNRTIVLTTHYMEEADVLGDRIVIMAEGEVQCIGSPMFLKSKFGTGYHLHVVKANSFEENGLTTLINEHVPGSDIEKNLEKEISYNLASSNGDGFGEMFENLEKEKANLGVISYGVTVTTMEDVFLNVANISDMKYKLAPTTNGNSTSIEIEGLNEGIEKVVRDQNLVNQMVGLLLKRFHYAKRYWTFLLLQIGLPFLALCLCLYESRGHEQQLAQKPLKLDITEVYGKTDGFYSNQNLLKNELDIVLMRILKANSVSVKRVDDPTQYVLSYRNGDLSDYLKWLLVGGSTFKSPTGHINITAWFNGEPYHVLPMALSMMHTTLLNIINGSGSISLTNAPLPQSLVVGSVDNEKIVQRVQAAFFFPMILAILSGSFVFLPIHENVTKAKLLQLMNGLSPVFYWLSMFIWDYLTYFCITILMIIPFSIFSHYAFFGSHSNAIGVAILLFLAYGWAAIPFSYVSSFLFKRGMNGFSAVTIVAFIFGSGTVTILVPIITMGDGYTFKAVRDVVWSFRILPPFAVGMGFSNLFGLAYSNAHCESYPSEELEYNCDSPSMSSWNPLFVCCKNLCGDNCLEEIPLLTTDPYACGRDILFLIFDGFLYFGIMFLFEMGVISILFKFIKRFVMKFLKKQSSPSSSAHFVEDSDVLAEEQRVLDIQATQPHSSSEALMAVDLTKIFKNIYAVQNLTFSVHEGECFGLLGVNGAGKTTTFRMLTGDCRPDKGTAIIKDCTIYSDLRKFQSYIGYCPQFDALIDRLSGRETLYLYGRLRGLSGPVLDAQVNKLIKLTDLTAHANKESRLYSGGNKRKLSVAIALIGSPPLLLLDEPTAGVDPVSRRKIWKILAEARRITGSAIVLTSHSMEESEALCSRLAIMVNGRFRCMGSIQQLKSKYGEGYSLVVKVKRQVQDDIEAFKEIKTHVDTNLPGAILKDDHQGMLQYHIIDPTMTLSHLFKFMSEMKNQFELEDYLISDTSLEQIFLTFARSQRVSE